jgi:hypothetical protein
MSKDWYRCLQPGGVWLVTVAPPTAIGRKRKHAATSNHAQQVNTAMQWCTLSVLLRVAVAFVALRTFDSVMHVYCNYIVVILLIELSLQTLSTLLCMRTIERWLYSVRTSKSSAHLI